MHMVVTAPDLSHPTENFVISTSPSSSGSILSLSYPCKSLLSIFHLYFIYLHLSSLFIAKIMKVSEHQDIYLYIICKSCRS